MTPEAVVLDFELAGAGSRTAARLIDLLVQGLAVSAFSIAGVILGASVGELPTWVGVVLVTLGAFAVLVLYPLLFEWLWDGRTLGKAALGLRVVTTEGAPINFREASVRAAVGLLEIYGTSAVAGLVVMLATSRSQRAGDLAASTIVLRQRHAVPAPGAIAFLPPEGREEFALSLDVSRLTTQEYAVIRSMLTRATSMHRRSRELMADDLGRQVAQRLAVRPPDGITAEGFLSCVAAAYQRRFNLAR